MTVGGPPEPVPDDVGVRRALRGLPAVDPPPGFFPGLVRRSRRRARALVGSGAVATIAVLGLAVTAESGIDEHEVSPPLDQLLDQHEAVARDADDAADGFRRMPDNDPGAPYWAPARVGSFRSMGAYVDDHDVMHVAYSDGWLALSVFEQPGELDRAVLGREDLEPAEGGAWLRTDDGVMAMVVERNDMVYTVVGEADSDEMAAMAERLPGSRSMGVMDRLREIGDDVMDLFSVL